MPPPASQTPSAALALLKLALFTFFVPCTVTLWAPRYFFPAAYRADPMANGSLLAAGMALVALGAAGYFWCALDFAFTGRGTPAPIDPPKVLVVRGLYRYARNPMYISVLLVLFGESALFRSGVLLRYALAVWAGFHLFVMFYEEPTLRDKFGDSYEDYCKRVNRWFPRRPHS